MDELIASPDIPAVDQEWIYEHAADGSARFVLGTVGSNPLVCFGINPSTAVPNAPDRTISRVSSFAAHNGFDSWTMLNVYPQIATDPKDLDRVYRPDLKAENDRQITRFIDGRPLTLLAAWGGLIESRPYLQPMLLDILQLTASAGCDWMSLGQPTKRGHPRHPLYMRGDTPLESFDTGRYLSSSPQP
ncbi:DUF1643 domain-containing protein [Agromyces endophyticus]|uniref:DUF1643 domain-containing protein n=1 Tax=Agromyces sp. H17E-10 TaxID=2932244 RepID=UPI001FD53727|nr:DUF1643 domain-containing protein [Agromyces sp. H17E-10]UOQ88032.1 DUF1643 domain-containing protein [Agromyces sp. H17E-10]